MSFFPFIGVEENTEGLVDEELPLLKDIAIDFKTGSPILENKTFKIVEGAEALKVWIYRAIKIDRYKYLIYSWDFGSEISDLIGKGYTQALKQTELKRYIGEALLINPYIKSVKIGIVDFDEGLLTTTVQVESVYGQVDLTI